MRYFRHVILVAVLGGIVVLPAMAEAQSRGRAVPRGSSRAGRPPGGVVAPPYRSYYRPYRPGVGRGFYYGSPWFIGPYSYGLGYYYGYPYGYSYGYGGYPAYGYGSPYPGYGARLSGGVRLAVAERDAEVYVDGYYAGVVDDFDGAMQRVELEPGPHHIEIRAVDLEPVSFDVNVDPGRTITYRASLRRSQP
jgi:hypothetical protein